MSRGFTVVEILVTLVVLTILLSLSVVGLSGVQAGARDSEREVDIAAIARGLEQRYERGNTYITNTSNPSEGARGSYPGVNEMVHILGEDRGPQGFDPAQITGGYESKVLTGTSESSFESPTDTNAFFLTCVFACSPAGNAAQIQSGFTYSNDRYLYEPYRSDGTYCCCGDCSGYNLYWKKESENWALQTVKSKRS